MSKRRRTFTLEEKLLILKEAEQEGIKKTLDKYGLSYSVLFRWRHKLEVLHKLNLAMKNFPTQQEFNDLLEENSRLKSIIAKQALDIQIKQEQIANLQRLKNSNP